MRFVISESLFSLGPKLDTMRLIHCLLLLVSTFVQISGIYSQTAGLDESVIVLADARENPPSIKLRWYLTLQCQGFRVSRKLKDETSFVQLQTGISPNQNFWVDTAVVPGVEYEYMVHRYGGNSTWTGSDGFGYISAGIRVQPPEHKGRILLVLDSTLVTNPSLKTPIWQWQQDAAGDGWIVETVPVGLTETPAQVKQRISTLYNQFNHDVRSVFVLGHVAIPYSGIINPDGHDDHLGAWPADGYYGDMDGIWTDNQVNINALDSRNRNIPGDGKFDQSVFPGKVDLEVGRVDMRNLPMFNMTEAAQIRRYLLKNHRFRTHLITVTDRAMHDDQATGLNFGATAWRGFTSLCRNINIPTNEYGGICTGNFRSTLLQYDYLWSGSWGPGSYYSVGTNQNSAFVVDSFRTVFTSFIGSYFGDWDSPANNFMRAALSNKGPILTTCWSGRPFWYFHHMGMGECIGYAARLTMNNESLYPVGSRTRQVHISLLGDPTLRLHPMGLVRSFQAIPETGRVALKWRPPSDTVLGYVVYKKQGDRFERLHSGMITDTTFSDSCLKTGQAIYMVRARRLEGARTGTYWNLSTGVLDTVSIASVPSPAINLLPLAASYCSHDTVHLRSVTQNVHQPLFQWFRNDTLMTGAVQDYLDISNPIHQHTYKLRLINRACQGFDTVFSNSLILAVNQTITPTVQLTSAIPSQGICEGKGTTFTAHALGHGSTPAFTWSVNQTTIGSSGDSTLVLDSVGIQDTIKVYLYSSAPCAHPNPVVAQMVPLVHPNPVAAIIQTDSLLLAAASQTLSYQWLFNSGLLSGKTDSQLVASASGFYSVVVTNGFGCSDTSQAVQVTLVKNKMHIVGFRPRVFPNPFQRALTIEGLGSALAEITLTDGLGRIISRPVSHSDQITIETNQLLPGYYHLKVVTAETVFRTYLLHL